MESRKIRFSCGKNIDTETLAAQSSLGFWKLQRIGIKTDDMPARSYTAEKSARVSAKAQCAIDSNIRGPRIENLEDFIDHDWHMTTSRSLARGAHAGERLGIP